MNNEYPKSWIIPAQVQMPQPTSTHNHMPILGNVTSIILASTPSTTPRHFQTTLSVLTNNEHWGDNLMNPKPLNTFHVLSKNINTLSTKKKCISWKASSYAISVSNAGVIALQETNLAWDTLHRQRIQHIMQGPKIIP